MLFSVCKHLLTDTNNYFYGKTRSSPWPSWLSGKYLQQYFLPSVTVYPGTGRTYSRCYFLETSCWPKGRKNKTAKNTSELIYIGLVMIVLRVHQNGLSLLMNVDIWRLSLEITPSPCHNFWQYQLILNKVCMHCWAHLAFKQEYKNISDLTETRSLKTMDRA